MCDTRVLLSANLGPTYRNGNCTRRTRESKFIYSAAPIDAVWFPQAMQIVGRERRGFVCNCLPLRRHIKSTDRVGSKRYKIHTGRKRDDPLDIKLRPKRTSYFIVPTWLRHWEAPKRSETFDVFAFRYRSALLFRKDLRRCQIFSVSWLKNADLNALWDGWADR